MSKRYFELVDGTSSKFWEVWREGTQVFTRYGKIGSQGQIAVKPMASDAEAQKTHDKLVGEKTKKGYVEGGAGKSAPAAAKPVDKPPAKPVATTSTDIVAEAPAEIPTGAVRLEFEEGTSSKFWQVSRAGTSYTVTYGKIGTAGQSQTKSCAQEWEARREVQKLIDDKKKKGYRVVSDAPAGDTPVARDATLEAAILADPTNDDNFAVYADWLGDHGDVRGEVANVQQQAAKSPKDRKLANAAAELVWANRAQLWGALAPYVLDTKPDYGHPPVAGTWRAGWLDTLRLSASTADGVPQVSDVAELVRLLPQLDSARFLRELVIACPIAEGEFHFEAGVAALVAALPSLPLLRRLTLGDFTAEDSELSWSHLGSLAALWPAAPKLEYLKIHAGSMALGTIDAPALRELRIETGGLDKATCAAIARATFPALETLVLWFGRDDYGGDCTVDDVVPLLDGARMPKLRHLGLANTPFGDELAPLVARARILPRLAKLDLSMSHLTTDGLQPLVDHADALAHLDELDLSRCLLDAGGKKLAKSLAKTVHLDDQEDPEEYAEDDWRYTAVGE